MYGVATALPASATGVLEQPAAWPPPLQERPGHRTTGPASTATATPGKTTGPSPGSSPPGRRCRQTAHFPSYRPALSDTAQRGCHPHSAQPSLPGGVCNWRSRCQSRTSAQPAQTPSAARLAHTEMGTRTIAKTNMIHASIVISSLLHALHGVLPTFHSNRTASSRQFPIWASGPCGKFGTRSLRQKHRRCVGQV